MANEWQGVIHSTAPRYMKGAEDLTVRERIVLSFLKSKGRIKFNENSHTCVWDVEFSEPPIEPYADGGVLNFQRHDPMRQLMIDWRGYVGTDQMTRKERLMNSGNEAIYRRYDKIIPNLMRSITNKFGSEWTIDGYASGNENRLCGIESFMGKLAAVTSNSKVALPSDTYGMRSTALQNQGGYWSANLASGKRPYQEGAMATDWPDGQGSSEYDYLAPKLLNEDHDWGGGAVGWNGGTGNAEYIIRKGVIWLSMLGGKSGMPDLFLTNGQWYAEYLDQQSAKQRIIVPHKDSSDLGFGQTVNQEGVGIYRDFDVPAGVGYFLNFDKMKLCSLSDQLFFRSGPEWSIETQSWLFNIGFFGNMQFQPKYFGKVADMTV
ncbi:MAG: hypothetical protein E6R03_16270 [Hyphomicrobiaceae bacterium]|nr:MAG: hypothetical protein E6R03_16270 [Hyphomicrobiaceae bacterium]